MIKDNWVKLKETKTMNEKYETIYAFKEKSEKDIWYDYSNDAQFAYAENENKDILLGFHDMQKTIQQIKLSS